jgi:hypothetical protein
MRAMFAVLIAVLLVAGTAASAVCEMTCLPQTQTHGCCQHHSESVRLTTAHLCEHPQNSATIAINVVTVPPFTATVAHLAGVAHTPFLHMDFSLEGTLRPLAPIPLRI